MSIGLLGKKIGMTHLFTEKGKFIPVTVIEAGPCDVIQKKTLESDSYGAVQLGFEDVSHEGNITKPTAGHFKKANVKPKKCLKEFRVDKTDEFEVAQQITVDIFNEGDFLDITGVSKGKGFAGVIKRHGFAGGPASHGSRFHRAPGSIGQCASPARVFKGKKLPGRLGGKNVTIQSLELVKVDKEKNLLLVKGAVPGANKGYLVINKAVKKAAKKSA